MEENKENPTLPVQNPSTGQVPPTPQAKPKRKLPIIIAGILVIVLALIIGRIAFIYKNEYEIKKIEKSINTSTWQTYTDNNLGLSYKYPSDTLKLSVDVHKQNDGWGWNPKTMTVENFIDKTYGWFIESKQKITISGKEGILVVSSGKLNETFLSAYFAHKEDLYSLHLRLVGWDYPRQETLATFSKILSTFKFTELASQRNQTKQLIGQFFWDVPPGSIANTEEQGIKSAFAVFDPKVNSGQRLAIVGIEISSMSANFGSASMQVRNQNNDVIPTGGFEYLLSKMGNSWKITAGGASNFCDILKSMPEDMLKGRREYYIGCFPKN